MDKDLKVLLNKLLGLFEIAAKAIREFLGKEEEPEVPEEPKKEFTELKVYSIEKASFNQLVFFFHSTGLEFLNWKILQDGALIETGRTEKLSSARVAVTPFKDFKNGKYTLFIDGEDTGTRTFGTDSIEFEITDAPVTDTREQTDLKITEILSVAPLTFRFHSEGLQFIDVGVRHPSGSKTSIQVGPLTSNVVQTGINLTQEGTHTLMISGQDTETRRFGTDAKEITIQGEDKPEPEVPEEPEQPSGEPFVPVYAGDGSVKVEGTDQRFSFVEGKDIRVEILPGDKVRLKAARTQRSPDGSRDLKLVVTNGDMAQLKDEEVDKLLAGVKLPAGDHCFHVWYYAYDLVVMLERYWELQGQGRDRSHVGSGENIYLTVQDKVEVVNEREIKDPPFLRGDSLFPMYHKHGATLELPKDKIYGPTKFTRERDGSIDWPAILKAVTHTQWSNPLGEYRDADRTWITAQTFPMFTLSVGAHVQLSKGQSTNITLRDSRLKKRMGRSVNKRYDSPSSKIGVYWHQEVVSNDGEINITVTANEDVNEGFTFSIPMFDTPENVTNAVFPVSKEMPTFGEQCENGYPFDLTMECRKILFEKMKERFGVKHPNETYITPDYFDSLYGFRTTAHSIDSKRKWFLLSKENARHQEGPENQRIMSAFYATGADKFCNRKKSGYMDSEIVSGAGKRIYADILDYCQQVIADPHLKIVRFGWISMEGGQSPLIQKGFWQRLSFPGRYDVLRLVRGEFSYEMNRAAVFFSLLFGNGSVSWHDNAGYGQVKEQWNLAHIGGPSDWKTQTHDKETGAIVNYNGNPPRETGKSGFSDGAAPGCEGEWAGAKLYEAISTKGDRVSKSILVPAFTMNGTRQFTASEYLPQFGKEVIGGSSIVDLWEQKLPVVLVTEGTAGKAVIIKNPFAGPTERYVVDCGAFGRFEPVGNGLKVFKI